MELRTSDTFLNELCPQVRPLITQIMEREEERDLLALFRRRPLTWLQVDDIAYYLQCSQAQVNEILNRLVDAGIVQDRFISGLTFFSVTNDSEISNALEAFWSWSDNWNAHLEQIKHHLRHDTTRNALAALINH
jgi:predicted transcriptional regulator